MKCYLIEVNTNPCPELSSSVLRNVIPAMLDNALALTLDCCYPPHDLLAQYHKKYSYPLALENKFSLVFDENITGREIAIIYEKEGVGKGAIGGVGVGDDDENFESCEKDDEGDY
jgi:tubulin polyglutamylase TTLL1